MREKITMKKTLGITAIVLILFAPVFGNDEDQEKKDVKAKISVGAKVTGNDGYIGKVGEYDPLDDGIRPFAKAKIRGVFDKLYFDLKSMFNGNSKDQRHQLNMDIDRIVDVKVNYDSFIHRLDHDPLTNMDVTSEARSGVFHTDYDPTKEYRITRSEFSGQAQITVPNFPVKFYANYRDERRSGEYQARTLSKCASCHIVAKSRTIDNSNKDYQLGGNVSIGKANVDYSYTKTQFTENAAAPTNTYLRTLHPEKVIPVFDSRISYDSRDGALPFDMVPDTDKQTHLVKANVPLFDNSSLSAQYVNSSVRNNYTDLEINSSALAGGFATRIGKKGLFSARVNHISIDNDSYYVDIYEPTDVAGPNAGKTYAEAYTTFGTVDYTRYSALSRDVLDIDANLKYTLLDGLKARLQYEYKKIDRENFEVETTKSNTFKGSLDYKPSKQWKFKITGRLKNTQEPFTNLYSGVAPEVQTFNPGNPFGGNQFYVFHRAREVHLTNVPTQLLEARGVVSWNPSYRFSISGNIMFRAEKNNEINFTNAEWARDINSYGVNVWFAPQDKVDVTISYYNYSESIDSLFAIPVLEGCGGGIIGGFPGTLTDMVDYDVDTHTAFLNANFYLSEKVSLYGNLTYNNSKALMSNLVLNTNQLDWIPAVPISPFDFEGIAETVNYSDLSLKQFIAEAGFMYRITESLGIKGAGFYYFYDDLAPFLFDSEGKTYSCYLGFAYNF
jgi:hypothetical protein